MNKYIFKSKKFRLLLIAVVLIFCIIISIFTLTKSSKKTTNKDTTSINFDNYVNKTFKDMVTSDSLTLHYTISDNNNYKKYGIDKIPASFGNIPLSSKDPWFTYAKKQIKKLDTFSYKKLTTTQQYVYDCMYQYFLNIDNSKEYFLYNEYLTPSTGIQIQLPILLTEYDFSSKKDVDNYLKLLPDIERYFNDICEFEKLKAKNNLFMSKNSAKKILKQCKNIMLNISTSSYISEFNNKVENIKDITQNEIYDYEKKNEDIVLDKVLNAYTTLYSTINELNQDNSYTGQLCLLDEGKKYYELYIKDITGSNRSIKNIISILENTITQENNAILSFINKNSDVDPTTLNKSYGSNDTKDIISTLKTSMIKDFPKIKNVKYKLKDVPTQLEENMGPAFYVTSPIDNNDRNTIYINKGAAYLDTPIFTNIAHEVFPGHLYQNYYFNQKNAYPIRNLMKNLGYIEGWSSYVTLISYSYSELDNYYANLYKYNNAIVLCLSARADIGVHYENWTKSDMEEYFNKNNCPLEKNAIDQLYNIIIEEPGDYLPYAVGYIEITRLLEEAKNKQGDKFNLKKFHTALLDAGPAPFTSIKSHIKY